MEWLDKDFTAEAVELMHNADSGDAQAQYTFGIYLLKEVDGSYRKDLSSEEVERGLRYLQAAAAQGHFHGIAADALGMIYYDGVLVPVDYEKAKMWFNTSYMKGIPTGIYMLGECAYYGQGEDIDYEKAAKLYIKVAGNYINTIYRLGDMYLNGYYLPYDPEFAKELYEHVLKEEEKMHKKFGFYSSAYEQVCNRLDNLKANPPAPIDIELLETKDQTEIRNKLIEILRKKDEKQKKADSQPAEQKEE